ncbi:DUF6300 family protein [Streptomyces tsukubensis]|uniref:DUF6300 family protein n=1 Tax=Streptomyces tsukubensis TaxID=83656 RepID=UPI00344EA267
MTTQNPTGTEEVVLTLEETPPCPSCGQAALLLARFPHAWRNTGGREVAGIREAVLCAACDHDDAAAAELIALFTVDDQVSPENLETFSALTVAWVASVRQRTVDTVLLQEEHERWSRGEL